MHSVTVNCSTYFVPQTSTLIQNTIDMVNEGDVRTNNK